jgi:hypothetical protein
MISTLLIAKNIQKEFRIYLKILIIKAPLMKIYSIK